MAHLRIAPIVFLLAAAAGAEPRATEIPLDVHGFKIIERESGDVNYYRVLDVPEAPYIHSEYKPGTETAVLGHDIPDEAKAAQKLRWTWRAMTLPKDGNECLAGHGDSAGSVYVAWKRGIKWYVLKYVWSSTLPVGSVCDKKRNPLVFQDSIVAETGMPTGIWKSEEIDLAAEFKKHFGTSDLPELKGVALMSDGDQTNSESSADFGKFVLVMKK